MSENTGHNTN